MFFGSKVALSVGNSQSNIDSHDKNDKLTKTDINTDGKSVRFDDNHVTPAKSKDSNDESDMTVHLNIDKILWSLEKSNKAMTAQTMLSCSDRCNEAIKLLEGTLSGKKSVVASNKDLQLPLKALKCMMKEVEGTATLHLGSYDKAVKKRKH
eukprot:1697449-Ditylum_brightwellii.AAC.1